MFSFKVLAPLAVAAGIVVGAPGSAAAAQQDGSAHARGGDAVVLTYPSIVQTRLLRTQAAINRSATYVDEGQPASAITALEAAGNNLTKAWRGAKYVIKTTPPPPPTEDKLHEWAFRESGRLRIDRDRSGGRHKGDPQTGPVFATIYDTAFAVLTLQHYASTTAVSLIEEANGSLLQAVRATVTQSLDERTDAIAYIHSIAPPPPPPEDKRGDPVVASWDTVMPNVVPYLDDEIQQIGGTIEDGALPAATSAFLSAAATQITTTKDTVNQYWPPIPTED